MCYYSGSEKEENKTKWIIKKKSETMLSGADNIQC